MNKYLSTDFLKKPRISVEITQGLVIFQQLFAVFSENPWINVYSRFYWKSAKKRYLEKKPRISKSVNKKTANKEDGLYFTKRKGINNLVIWTLASISEYKQTT